MKELIERLEAVQELSEANEAQCREQYVDVTTGRFKGGNGERFENCIAFMKCKGGISDPEGLCAEIARKKGLAAGQKGEDVEFGPHDADLLLTEAERVQKSNIVRAADAMVNSPMASRFIGKLGMAGYEMQLQQTIEAMLTQMLHAKGVGVSGASQALRAIRGLGRGTMPMG